MVLNIVIIVKIWRWLHARMSRRVKNILPKVLIIWYERSIVWLPVYSWTIVTLKVVRHVCLLLLLVFTENWLPSMIFLNSSCCLYTSWWNAWILILNTWMIRMKFIFVVCARKNVIHIFGLQELSFIENILFKLFFLKFICVHRKHAAFRTTIIICKTLVHIWRKVLLKLGELRKGLLIELLGWRLSVLLLWLLIIFFLVKVLFWS